MLGPRPTVEGFSWLMTSTISPQHKQYTLFGGGFLLSFASAGLPGNRRSPLRAQSGRSGQPALFPKFSVVFREVFFTDHGLR